MRDDKSQLLCDVECRYCHITRYHAFASYHAVAVGRGLRQKYVKSGTMPHPLCLHRHDLTLAM